MTHDEVLSEVVFPPPQTQHVGPAFGVALGRVWPPARARIRCFAPAGAQAAAQEYLQLIGAPKRVTVIEPSSALLEIAELGSDVCPLLVLPATTPGFRDLFFGHPWFHFFVDHHYRPCVYHQSPALFTVGTTAHVLSSLQPHWCSPAASARAVEERRLFMRRRHGKSHVDDAPLSHILRSSRGTTVRLHCLGPEGTNISKAGRLFLRRHGLDPDASLVVHGRSVEPLEYSAVAASEIDPQTLPLHMECAVFYDMHTLFMTRRDEVVFAGHQYMPLDEMQLATRSGAGLRATPSDRLVIASHPSPRGLARRLVECGAEIAIASSNADAAVMVAEGRADACITTESARGRSGLETFHRFGSPMMLFTIGTPLSARSLFARLGALPGPLGVVRPAAPHPARR